MRSFYWVVNSSWLVSGIRHRLARVAWTAGLAWTTASFCACNRLAPRTPTATTLPADSILKVQLTSEPISLDPGLAEDGVSLTVLNNIWDGLVGYDSSGKLVPRLAETVSISRDRKRYEFILRKNAAWSDGQPVKAEDFVFALERTLSPHSRSKLGSYFLSIRGARAYHAGQASWDSVEVKVKLGHLIFQLERESSFFLDVLTLPPAFPLRPDVLGPQWEGSWPDRAPTTGPYQMIEHQIDRKIILVANPHYWRKSGRIPKIELQIILDESAAVNLFELGQLDLLTRVPSLDFPRLQKSGWIRTNPFLATYYLSFNCRKWPFNQRLWRRSVAGVIRRDEIVQLLAMQEIPARSWIPRGLEGYEEYEDPSPVFADSVAAFRVRSRGEGSQASRELRLGFDAGTRNLRVMEKVQHDLSQKLGLKVFLMPLDWRAYAQQLETEPPELYRYGWLSPIFDSISHLKVFKTGDLNNHSGFSNFNYDKMIDEIESMDRGPTRTLKIRQAQKILVEEEAAVVPLFHYVQNTGVSARIQGFQMSPFGVIRFEDLKLAPGL